MAHINLLDWRGELRNRKRAEFFTMLGLTAALGAVLVGGIFFFQDQQITGQKDRNTYLETEIKAVDIRLKEIKNLEKARKALLDRMEVIQALQASRPNIVRLFDKINTTLPSEGMYLTSLKQSDKNLKISGKSESNSRVSNYMRNINNSGLLENSRLTVIKTEQKSGIKEFSLEADVTDPNAKNKDSGD